MIDERGIAVHPAVDLEFYDLRAGYDTTYM